jgi:hypothetical protein
MSTPLADKTNNVAAFSPPQSPAKQLDVQQAAAPDLLSPVPPPPAEEVAASDPPRASTFETLLARVPAASDDALKRMAAGHVAFGLLFFTGVSPITVASWGVLAALIANGVATTVRTPATVTPPSVDALLQPIEFGLHAALALWARYKRGSPRLSFGTAVAAWSLAVSSAHISALALVWALYTSATSACAVKNERVSVYVDALAPHATAFCTRLAALSARIELPPAVAASAKAFVAYYPLIVGFVWAFLLDCARATAPTCDRTRASPFCDALPPSRLPLLVCNCVCACVCACGWQGRTSC